MHIIDYIIILLYLGVLVFLGFYFRQRAGNNINEYFLGNRNIPWWVLGASGMASNLDITGTMLIASLFYVFGVKGFLVEIRGGVVLVLAFMMILLGKWHSRSGVMTIAEWMEFRFGTGKQGSAARLLSTLSVLLGTIGIIGYFFVGIGKFLSLFLPFSPMVCALLMITVALFYTALSGLWGVVYTDLIQAGLIGFTTLYVSAKAFFTVDRSMLDSIAPAGWSDIIPSWQASMPSGYEMYNLFGISILFFFLKTIIEGLGTPGAYMAQRYFAAQSDRDSGRLSILWIFLLSFRWPFIIGIAVLGLSLGTQVSEPEMVLPTVLSLTIPTGLKGIVLASLIAAAMSTFDSTINAAASYMVKDVYLKYMKPNATKKQAVRASYVSSVLIVALGVLIGLAAPSINSIWGWITMSLVAGIILPNLLRWYWWRFNGYGYACGTGIGMVGALTQRMFFPSLQEWQTFLIVGFFSLVGMIACTLLTPATDDAVLEHFYRQTRPIGFWRKIRKRLDQQFVRETKRENRRDLIALFFAVPWQISLFLVPVFAIIHKWETVTVFAGILILSSIGLYVFWFRFLNRKSS
jgi:Na+/proline symporter